MNFIDNSTFGLLCSAQVSLNVELSIEECMQMLLLHLGTLKVASLSVIVFLSAMIFLSVISVTMVRSIIPYCS